MGLASAVMAMVVAAEPFSVAVGRISLEGYFEVGEVRLVEEAVQGLGEHGLAVVSPGQARVTLGAARKAELDGCQVPGVACVVALGQALGVQGVLRGRITRTGFGGVGVSLQVFSSRDGRALTTSYQEGADGSSLPEAVRAGAGLLASDLRPGWAEDLEEHPRVHAFATSPLMRKAAWASLALSAVGAIAGTVILANRLFYLGQVAEYVRVNGPNDPINYLRPLTAEADRLVPWIIGAYVTSAVALTAFGVLRWLGMMPTEVAPVLVLQPGGAVAGFTGTF